MGCGCFISTVDIRPASTVDIKPISTVDMKQPQPRPLKVKAEMLGHPWGFWRICVDEGYDAVVFALPRVVLEGVCKKNLLHSDVCEALYEAWTRA